MAFDSPRRGCAHVERVFSGSQARRRGQIASDEDVRNNVAVINANAALLAAFRGPEPLTAVEAASLAPASGQAQG